MGYGMNTHTRIRLRLHLHMRSAIVALIQLHRRALTDPLMSMDAVSISMPAFADLRWRGREQRGQAEPEANLPRGAP